MSNNIMFDISFDIYILAGQWICSRLCAIDCDDHALFLTILAYVSEELFTILILCSRWM